MTGWLVANNFLNGSKYYEIYNFLVDAGRRRNIAIEIKKTGDLLFSLEEKIDLPDFVLFWDKDVNLAARLERLGARVFNSSVAIEVCDNKALTYMKLSGGNIKIPKTFLSPKTFDNIGYTNLDFLDEISERLGFPYIIKEVYGSFGQQVYLVNNTAEAKALVSGFRGREFVMQEFIKSSFGRDVRINVVGDEVVCAMLRYSVNDDFRSNITNGGKMKSFEPTYEQKQIALSACRSIGLDYAGVDVLFGENDEPIICEVNSNPHFKSTFECTKINMADKIIEYVLDKVK